MDLSRRRMLQGIAALAVTAVTPLRWVARADAAPGKSGTSTNGTTTSWFSRSTYVPLLGSAFTAGTATLTLAAIGDLTPPSAKEASTGSDGRFSLLFTSTSVLAQATRTVSHPSLGETSLFVVPVGPASTPRSYEVIVNRLT